MQNVTSGNNPVGSGEQPAWDRREERACLLSALATKACQRNRERVLWALTSIWPPYHQPGTQGSFLGEVPWWVRQGRNANFFLLGLGEMSSFVSHPSSKACGFLGPQEAGTIHSSTLLYKLFFALPAVLGWWWTLALCLTCMRKRI